MENTMRKDLFKKVFKSITADGGSEFMDFDGIVFLLIPIVPRKEE